MSEHHARNLLIEIAVFSKNRKTAKITTIEVPIPASLISDDEIKECRLGISCRQVTPIYQMDADTSFREFTPRWKKVRQ